MLVLKINYTKQPDRAGKSVRYHAFRTREMPTDQKGVFSRDSDAADVKAFVRSLDDPLTRPRKLRSGREINYAVMHRLMFSLSRREFEACGLTSWKPVIREALGAFERQHGIKLEWVAAEHQSRDHPHVHVDVKSVYTDINGNRHRLKITQDMRIELRKAVEVILERERARVRAEREHIRAMERGMERFADSALEALMRGLREAAREDSDSDPFVRRRRRRPEDHERDDDRDR
jgi:hypothetical protein